MLGLLILIFVVNTGAAESRRPKIGLVLGGGGARGIAHVGIIKVLEENHIPVDCIVGTSIGSLVGASYAVGSTPDEMRKVISEANWSNMFLAKAPRQAYPFRRKQDDKLSMLGVEVGLADGGQLKLPLAAISTQEIEYFMRNLTYGGTVANFDSLPIPYRAIATDLATGEMVILKDGDLVTAMRASMAVPGIFPSVPSKGHILADGGLVRNLPVDVARNLCADVVIAVDVGAAPLSQGEITGIFSVMDQYTRLMMIQNVQPQVKGLKDKDVFIAPVFDSLGSMDFEHSDKLIEVGRVAGLKALPSLKKYAVSEKEYAAWSANRIGKKLKPKPVKSVTVVASGWVNSETLKEDLKVPMGENLPLVDFHEQLMRLYATGDFSQLDYELYDSGTGQDLVVLPVQKNWGPNYLNFGLSLGTDFDSSYPWNLTAMYRRTWVNSLGAEWKNILQMGNSSMFYSEFYQPLEAGGNGFVTPYFRYYRIPLALWQDGDEVAKYKYAKTSFGADIGVGSEIGEFRLGPAFNEYSANRNIGPTVLPNSRTNDYGLRFNFFYDQLDNYFFPTMGNYLDLYGYYSVGGSEDIKNYGLYGLNYRGAVASGKGAFQFALKGQNSTGDNGVLADVSWLGGFLNLSSYRYQELLGDQFAYGSIQYYRRMAFLSGSYWGVALESGRVFNYFDQKIADEWHFSGTAYLAYDSILGPMYLAAAYGDNEAWSGYFMLGKQF